MPVTASVRKESNARQISIYQKDVPTGIKPVGDSDESDENLKNIERFLNFLSVPHVTDGHEHRHTIGIFRPGPGRLRIENFKNKTGLLQVSFNYLPHPGGLTNGGTRKC